MRLRLKAFVTDLIALIKQHQSAPKEVTSLYLCDLIGEETDQPELYDQAFTHKSYPRAPRGYNNERLEFLGDSVLSCIVGHALYEMYEDEDEGALSSLRAFVVSRSNMNNIALRLGLDQFLKAAPGLNMKQTNTLGNCLEALIGAIYLDKGFDFTQDFIRQHIIIDRKNIRKVSAKEEDYKTEFIILMQQHKVAFEFKHIDSVNEPQLGMVHRCEVLIGKPAECLAGGRGTSKKIAHQNAAKDALKLLKRRPELLKKHKGSLA